MSASDLTPKKREVLPFLHRAILKLTNMSSEAAKLELYDNDQASRRLKQELVEFTHGELKDLKECVFAIRDEINEKSKSNKIKTKQKQQTHESAESEQKGMERASVNFQQPEVGTTETEF